MPSRLFKKRRFLGFTLVEMLVIVSIIAILILAFLVVLSPKSHSTSVARDSKRVVEVNNLRIALQMYYMDKGYYPKSTPNEDSWCSLEPGSPFSCGGTPDILNELKPYLSKTPGDPLFGKGKEPNSAIIYSYQYISTSSGQGYKLHVDLETKEPYEVGSCLGVKIAYVSGCTCSNGTGENTCSLTPPLYCSAGCANLISDCIACPCPGMECQGGTTCVTMTPPGDGGTCEKGSLPQPMTEEWNRTYSLGDDWAGNLAVDSDNNIIITGRDNTYGSWYPYTVKYGSDGTQLWVKSYTLDQLEAVPSVAVDSDKNVIIAGCSSRTPSIYLNIIKYSPDGTQLWNNDDVQGCAGGVAVDSEDNIIVIGGDYSVYKFSKTNGALLLDKDPNYPQSVDAIGVAVDSENNIIATGYRINSSIQNCFTAKYDSAGNELWGKYYGSSDVCMGDGVTIDDENNIIMTGWLEERSRNVITIKYSSSSGGELWTRTYDSGLDGGEEVAVDSHCNIVVAGYTGPKNGSNDNWLILAYDYDGTELWSKIYDYFGKKDRAVGVAFDKDGNLIVGGWKTNVNKDYYIIKY